MTPVAPVAVAPTTTTTTTNVDSAKIDTAKANTAKVDTTTVKPTSTKTAQASHQRHTGDHSDDSVTIGGVKVNGGSQLKTIMNRSDVKSILSQYGLN